MKRFGHIAAIMAICVLAVGAFAGCGANLNREVSVQGMTMEVPSDWLEEIGTKNNDLQGTISFVEEDKDRDEDETEAAIKVSYHNITQSSLQADAKSATNDANTQTSVSNEAESQDETSMTAEAPVSKTDAEAIAAKQARLEKEQGVIAWSIDKDKTRVVDGAQVTSYEYSFVKEIDGERRKYEFNTIYVVTPDMMYEISLVGSAVSPDALIDTIEF